MRPSKITFISIALLLLSAVTISYAQESSYVQIPLNSPANSKPIDVLVTRAQSNAYGWQAGQELTVRASVSRSTDKSKALIDAEGRETWKIQLNANKEGALSIYPNKDSFSGRLEIRADEKILYAVTPFMSEVSGKILEKVYEYSFQDGAKIKVHYTDQILGESGAQSFFPKEVLDAAVFAYQTITQFQGFSSEGYTFANPDKSYAYDPDKTIDIYIGNPGTDNPYPLHGFSSNAFRDAPCFDTTKISETQFNAVILLPANYDQFIKNWEKLNPSPLGKRTISVDLRGTLIHEMLHVILFYYNKNLNKEADSGEIVPGDASSAKKQIDWYVEGLARYFETFAGARHDFFSQGFKQVLPDKIRFSRGGSNYFMRYPDQPFTQLRYENALFWRFMDLNYGMSAIENLSRNLRKEGDFKQSLEKVTGVSFNQLLKKFALAILLNDFQLKEDQRYLKEIARTRLMFKENNLYLLYGDQIEENLGKICRTDWVGSWENLSAAPRENPVAGDNTETSDVSGWATDYVEMTIAPGTNLLPGVSVSHDDGGMAILVQMMLVTNGGSQVLKEVKPIDIYGSAKIDLRKIAGEENLTAGDISKVYFLITNTDPKKTSKYSLSIY